MANPVSVNEIASFCGITARRVQQLVKEGMPQEGRGKYNFAAGVRWYISYLQEQNKLQGSGTSNKDLKDTREQYLDIQRQSAELDLKQKIGELVDREETQIAVNEAMVIIATQMDGIGGRFANELADIDDPAQIRILLLNETRRIRGAAADRLQCLGAIEVGGKHPPTTTRKKRRPVGKSSKSTPTGKRRTGTVQKRKKSIHDSDTASNS